ncbi:response regulator [Halomicrobium urmianum]|uniref:response regulator n=1 Tax=Halomicrobium urmianum TaxID=1586233 RepID=UPI001CD9E22D|nr:response regulator [Halomicrobium urmianum]
MTIEVLIVDEDRDVLEVTEAFLGRHDDLAVATETDPEAALSAVRDGEYDAVVSDLTMPGLDGLALCREIRESRPELPFFLFTGREESDIDGDVDPVTAVVRKSTGTDQYDDLAERIRAAIGG